MAIAGMIHVNINCSDYDRSKAFYEVLGFKEVLRVPETNGAPEGASCPPLPPCLTMPVVGRCVRTRLVLPTLTE